MELTIHVDGGSRGNPGPAGAGVVIRQADGTRLHEAGYYLGNRHTNNYAEYQALIHALQRAQRLPADALIIHSDSELLVRQITGQYQVKAANLQALFEQVQMLLLKAPRWRITHVRREQNSRADELANMAMDARRDVIVYDVEQTKDAAQPADKTPGAETPRGKRAPSKAPDAATPSAENASAELDASDTNEAMADAAAPANAAPPSPTSGRAVRVTVAAAPQPTTCLAGGVCPTGFTIQHTVPAGLCIYAAQAILPTVLAILNTEPHEFESIPTMTVRCNRPACRAAFQLSPLPRANGSSKTH